MGKPKQIEIKVNVAGGVDRALGQLGLRGGEPRAVWFFEDLTPGLTSTHPLLDAGIVLRLRIEDDGTGDSTVKLRPCRGSQLVAPWIESDRGERWEYAVEGDWSGSRQVLAASLRYALPATALADALRRPGAAFRRRQREFLTACSSLRVNLDALTPLGAVTASRWKNVELPGVDGVGAERWQVGRLDFLELSVRAEPDEAERVQARFERAVSRAGLTIGGEPRANKTELVLAELAPVAANAA